MGFDGFWNAFFIASKNQASGAFVLENTVIEWRFLELLLFYLIHIIITFYLTDEKVFSQSRVDY